MVVKKVRQVIHSPGPRRSSILVDQRQQKAWKWLDRCIQSAATTTWPQSKLSVPLKTECRTSPVSWILSSDYVDECDAVSVVPTLASTAYGTEAPAELTKGLPQTAGEVLAYILSEHLDLSRNLENAPARNGRCLPRATVAWIAYDILSFGRSQPGPFLMKLLEKLLDVDRQKKGQSKQYSARSAATWILAQAPQLNSQAIALELGVNRSSVSRWRSDPTFQQEVKNIENYIARLKEDGKWSAYEKQAREGKFWKGFPSK